MENKNSHKQAFWFTIISYFGIAIGVFSTIFIYPRNIEFLGKIRYIETIAQLLFPVMVFGTSHALINFSPLFIKRKEHLLLSYGIIVITLISIFFVCILFFKHFIFNSQNYIYIKYAMPIAVSLAFIELFKKQAITLEKITLPAFYERILPKIALPVIFLLFIYGNLNESLGLLLFALSYITIAIIIIIYVFKYLEIKIKFNFRPLFAVISKKQFYNYAFFAFLGSFGSFFAFRIDTFIIPQFLNFQTNGIYSIAVSIAMIISIPAIGLNSIYTPLISKLLKEKKYKQLGQKYTDTATLLFFIGALIYGSIVLGIDSFFQLLSTYDTLYYALPVIYILGLNVLINISAGFNSEIISYSSYYKYNIYFLIFLAIFNTVLNILVLTKTQYGIIGVSFTTLFSLLIFNLAKLIFIYKKFNIQPFDKNYIKLIVLLLITFFVFFMIPNIKYPLLNLFIKVGGFLFIIIPLTYRLKYVYGFNFWLDRIFFEK